MLLNYATLRPEGKVTYKTEEELSSYDVLKKELDQATFSISQVDELDVWYDDEFLLKEQTAVPSFIIKNSPEPKLTDWDVYLCGPIVFASSDEEGNTVSLTEKAQKILRSLRPATIGPYKVWIYYNYSLGGK